MDRREYLTLLGLGAASSIAGCGGAEDGDDEPTPEPLSDPIEASHRGTGAETIDGFEVELRGPTIATVQHEGDDAFAIELFDAEGEAIALLASGTGTWLGSNAFDVPPGEYAIEVEAGDLWQLTAVQQPVYTREHVTIEWPIEIEGATDDVYGPVDFADARSLSIRTWGEGDNAVVVRDSRGAAAATVFEETGRVDADTSVSIDDAVGWIDVEMSGSFELTVDEAEQ